MDALTLFAMTDAELVQYLGQFGSEGVEQAVQALGSLVSDVQRKQALAAEVLEKALAQETAQKKYEALSPAEREALAQYIQAKGIEPTVGFGG